MFKKCLGVLMSHGKRMFKGGIAGVMTVMSFFGFPVVSFAGQQGGTTGGGGGTYLKPITSFTDIMIAILEKGGIAVLAVGAVSLGNAVRKQQQGGIEDAIGILILGGIMLGARIIIGVLS